MSFEIKPHEQRVLDERAELAPRIEKLGTFIDSIDGPFRGLPAEERWALVDQYNAMRGYLKALDRRIELWGLKP